MKPASLHTGAWRYPGAYPDANFNFQHHVQFARKLEAGLFDAIFLADSLATLGMPPKALRRSVTVSSFDPLTLLPGLAVVTERIGLIATASTTYNEPYHVARKFASLDHMSGGRAGWNLVTSGNQREAFNFGLEKHVEHAARYKRAREFYDVVVGLWDSWDDDAFIRDVEAGLYFDETKLHVLNHEGEHFKVRGPLNVARPIQGHPVVVQAGSSEPGRELAAETAEMVFTGQASLADGREFYGDVKQRMMKYGRAADDLKILPGAFVVVGETEAEARAKKQRLDALVHPEIGIAVLEVALGNVDLSGVPLDGPLPEIPETNSSKSTRQELIDMSHRDGLTVRQIAQFVAGSYGGLEMIGTPVTIADQMQTWLEEGACDGFNVMFPYLPGGLDDFVDMVVPELQRRGIFRTAYDGPTLRDNLGLKRPANPFFAD